MFGFSSIKKYHSSLQEGTVTCLQAVVYYLQQIQTRRHLNAFVNVYANEAIARAKQLDETRKKGSAIGKLHGVIIGIKDIIAYKDHPLTASSKILKGFSSIYSATAVKKILAEDFGGVLDLVSACFT